MTLISYLSRVHFADGVLEVALASELEVNKFRSALLVSESDVGNEFSDRVLSGLPYPVEVTEQCIDKAEATADAVDRLTASIGDLPIDVLIGFGSSRALCIADACCRRLRANNESDNASSTPGLIVVPGVDGVPTMCRSPVNTASHSSALRSGSDFFDDGIQPTAVIFDPTIILGETVERTASAVATTMARCLSAHLSLGYNPPAEGIAADGFRRIVYNLPSLLTDDTLEMRRELMAASLNGTLALHKISGIAADLCKVLVESSATPLDEGALMRLLIAIEVNLMDQTLSASDTREVRSVFGIPEGQTLTEWLTPLLQKLPLPNTFQAMGIQRDQLAQAANEVASRQAMQVSSALALCEMLNSIELTSA